MKKKNVKILVLGLDNSGKTSLVFSLQNKTNLFYYTSIQPTKGIKTRMLRIDDINYAIWDVGGQERYRNDFFGNILVNLSNTKKIIYVIDVQDEKRYSFSLQFLEKIVEILKKEKLSVKISIFLHKYDSDIEFSIETIDELITNIRNIFPEEFEFEIKKSTIYTILRTYNII